MYLLIASRGEVASVVSEVEDAFESFLLALAMMGGSPGKVNDFQSTVGARRVKVDI